MKILMVGGGGREHALVWKLRQSPRVGTIYCAPGNGGIAELARCVDIAPTDINALVAFAREKAVDWVFVAPDDPLALGLVDAAQAAGIRAFGPCKSAAALEGSKIFAKALMAKYGIPTARYEAFDDVDTARECVRRWGGPLVVKADGLALGKGVFVTDTAEQALAAVDTIMVDRAFGKAGARVIIEERLCGPEVSMLCFTDGKTVRPMVSSQDHKRAFDGDRGPNTGGMGAFAPSPHYTPKVASQVLETIIRPTVAAMAAEGRPFKGVLYVGLMLTRDGPKVLEYNARFGDPETQALLPLLKTDLMDIMDAVDEERLHAIDISWSDGAAVSVVMASGGYPGAYEKGKAITGLDAVEDAVVFHAGTGRAPGGLVTSGGRVLAVTGLAPTLEQAADKAYRGVEKISFDGAFYRKDIARR